MKMEDFKLNRDEMAIFLLRSLFEKFGYAQYKMNKFEEYDLYVRNKDFLISDGIITFTDTNGKLLALKPDVTLSIVKNALAGGAGVQKVYYDENVYRVSSGTQSFKEIMQVGIECIGDVDDYCVYEVLLLAIKSLKTLSDDVVLDVSHFGMLTDLIDSFGVSTESKRQMLSAIGNKNTHELKEIAARESVSKENIALLLRLTTSYGKPENVLPELKRILHQTSWEKDLSTLERLCALLSKNGYGDVLRIDFSVVNHTDYYNGIVFKGFVKGIPAGVLSGGQYDRLMEKMGRASRAIGFAVYLDLLDELSYEKKNFDVDCVLLYEASDSLDQVERSVKEFVDKGKSVLALKALPDKISFQELYEITKSGVKLLERHA